MIKGKKGNFYITIKSTDENFDIKNIYRTVSGYIYFADGTEGTNLINFGIYKDSFNNFVLSDIATGFMIKVYKTKKECLKWIEENEIKIYPSFKNLMRNEKYKFAFKNIIGLYEIEKNDKMVHFLKKYYHYMYEENFKNGTENA